MKIPHGRECFGRFGVSLFLGGIERVRMCCTEGEEPTGFKIDQWRHNRNPPTAGQRASRDCARADHRFLRHRLLRHRAGHSEPKFIIDTLVLLSKDKMRGSLLGEMWKAHFVDRRVRLG